MPSSTGEIVGALRPSDAPVAEGLRPPDGRTRGPRPGRLPAGVNLLDLLPVRLAAWREVSDERVVLLRPTPTATGVAGFFIRVSTWLAPPRLRLDPVGSQAWRDLDGRRSVASIAARLRERFGEEAAPAEERLGKLLRLLRRDGFLALPPYDEVAEPPI